MHIYQYFCVMFYVMVNFTLVVCDFSAGQTVEPSCHLDPNNVRDLQRDISIIKDDCGSICNTDEKYHSGMLCYLTA